MARGRPSKKGLIAEAALNLFQVAGYQGTSIDQVVLEARVSKPTVYSNYPSKRLLWQEVLNQIIERSKAELNSLTTQHEQGRESFSRGWIDMWEHWTTAKDRLAAYRIHWGESHKFSQVDSALFAQLEQSLIQALQRWMTFHAVSESHFFVLFAISREAFLLPKIDPCRNDSKLTSESITDLIDSLVQQNNSVLTLNAGGHE